MGPGKVLESYPSMIALGLAAGLAVGGFPCYTREISMAALALLMTVSLATVRLGEVKDRDHVKSAAAAFALNYGLLSCLILVLGSFFEKELWWGWVLMAAAPSAVAVMAFTTMLGGPTSKSLFSSAVIYVVALALMPSMSLALIGTAVSVEALVSSLLVLIVLPMALSRAVARARMGRSAQKVVMNLSFAVVVFAVAGSNRDAFLTEPEIVVMVSIVAAIRTFGVGLLIEGVLRWRGLPARERTTYVLFSSFKNLGLTATVAIALFEPVVAIPAAICIVFEVLWTMFLLRYYGTPAPSESPAG